jgi:hypothetical protein
MLLPQNRLKKVSVAMELILMTMAHDSNRPMLRELLQQTKSKFLAVILDVRASFVDRAPLKYLSPVPPLELRPAYGFLPEVLEEFLAGAEVRHPDMIPGFG